MSACGSIHQDIETCGLEIDKIKNLEGAKMQRISLAEKDQAHPLIREMYQKLEGQGLPVLKVQKVMGHYPYIGRNFVRLGSSIRQGEELPAKLRELAILRVGNLTQSEYELKQPYSHWTTGWG